MKKAVANKLTPHGVEITVSAEGLKEEIENLYKVYIPHCKDAGCMLVIMQLLDDKLKGLDSTVEEVTCEVKND